MSSGCTSATRDWIGTTFAVRAWPRRSAQSSLRNTRPDSTSRSHSASRDPRSARSRRVSLSRAIASSRRRTTTSLLSSAVRCVTSDSTAAPRPVSVTTKRPVRNISTAAPASSMRPDGVSPGSRSGRDGARLSSHVRPPKTTGIDIRRLAPPEAGRPAAMSGTGRSGTVTSLRLRASSSVLASRARLLAIVLTGTTPVARPRRRRRRSSASRGSASPGRCSYTGTTTATARDSERACAKGGVSAGRPVSLARIAACVRSTGVPASVWGGCPRSIRYRAWALPSAP